MGGHHRSAAVPRDLVGGHPRDPAARARGVAAARGPNSTSPRGPPPWKPSSTCTRSSRPNSAARLLRAGAVDVGSAPRSSTSAWLGWPVRTFEHAVPREKLGIALGEVRLHGHGGGYPPLTGVLESVVPPGLFYNAEVTGFRP